MTNSSPWYKDGLCFGCTQCGNCCSGGPGYVWVSPEEIGRIASFVEQQRLPYSQYVRKIGNRYSLTEKSDNDCIFLERLANGKTRCKIHPVKPRQCRTWPFWDTLLVDEEVWQEAKKTCPGIDQGRRYTQEEIERMRDGD